MTTSDGPSQEKSVYFSDLENAGEMARLIKQARYMTRGLDGLFPPSLELSTIHNVLDLACGPGEWVTEVAKTYPHMDVTGIDISHTMLAFAQQLTASLQLSNTHFHVMDATQPLDFPDASFDLVNARFLVGFMKTTAWSQLLAECRRLLRPGGIIVLTELEMPITTSPAFERFSGFLTEAQRLVGQSFSPDGRHFGIMPMLSPLLANAGFSHIQQQACIIDYSTEPELHAAFYDNAQVACHLMQPFVIKMGVTTQEEVSPLYHRMLSEVGADDFYAIQYLLRIWGSN